MDMATNDDDRATGVMYAVRPDRTKERAGESTVPSAAHDEQVCALGGIDKHLSRISLHDPGPNPDIAHRVDYLVDHIDDRFLRQLGEVGATVSHGPRCLSVEAEGHRILPRDQSIHSRAGKLGLPYGPAQRRPGGRRPIDPNDDGRSLIIP